MRYLALAALLLVACGPGQPWVLSQDASLPDAGAAPALICGADHIAVCPEGWTAGCATGPESFIARNASGPYAGACTAHSFVAPAIFCDGTARWIEATEGACYINGEPDLRCVPLFDGCPSPR